jgi:hypothetical protein
MTVSSTFIVATTVHPRQRHGQAEADRFTKVGSCPTKSDIWRLSLGGEVFAPRLAATSSCEEKMVGGERIELPTSSV